MECGECGCRRMEFGFTEEEGPLWVCPDCGYAVPRIDGEVNGNKEGAKRHVEQN